MSETILVINSGSSSLKLSPYAVETNHLTVLFSGTADGIGKVQGALFIKDSDGKQAFHEAARYKTQNDAFDHASAKIERLGHPRTAAIGHRLYTGHRTCELSYIPRCQSRLPELEQRRSEMMRKHKLVVSVPLGRESISSYGYAQGRGD